MIFDELWRKERVCSKLTKKYDKEINRLRRAGDDAEAVEQEASSVLGDAEVDLRLARSRALVRQAIRLHIPLPQHSDNESWDNFYGVTMLTTKGYAEVRKSIRQEKKERREMWTALVKDVFVPLGGIVISIISLLIAYAALKIKTHP